MNKCNSGNVNNDKKNSKTTTTQQQQQLSFSLFPGQHVNLSEGCILCHQNDNVQKRSKLCDTLGCQTCSQNVIGCDPVQRFKLKNTSCWLKPIMFYPTHTCVNFFGKLAEDQSFFVLKKLNQLHCDVLVYNQSCFTPPTHAGVKIVGTFCVCWPPRAHNHSCLAPPPALNSISIF